MWSTDMFLCVCVRDPTILFSIFLIFLSPYIFFFFFSLQPPGLLLSSIVPNQIYKRLCFHPSCHLHWSCEREGPFPRKSLGAAIQYWHPHCPCHHLWILHLQTHWLQALPSSPCQLSLHVSTNISVSLKTRNFPIAFLFPVQRLVALSFSPGCWLGSFWDVSSSSGGKPILQALLIPHLHKQS